MSVHCTVPRTHAPPLAVMGCAMLGALSTLLAPACVLAGVTPGGFVALTSDYVLRGVSQNDSQPTLQGDAHLRFASAWSAGVWASPVRLVPQQRSLELNAYLQWRSALSRDFDASASVTHYAYANDPRRTRYDYDELSLSLSWRDQLYATASWAPAVNMRSRLEGLARDRTVYTVELAAHRSLGRGFDAVLGAGFYDPARVDYGSYAYGNAALDWHYGQWQLALAAFWVQGRDHRWYNDGPRGGPLVLSVARSF